MGDEATPHSFLTVNIGSYFQVASGESYDEHIFVIDLHADGVEFTVDRSYVDFVDLDRRIRKKYPKIKLPALPLDGSSDIEKILLKSADRRGSLATSALPNPQQRESVGMVTRESFSATPEKDKSKKFKIRNQTEIVRTKVGALDIYLKKALSMHEVLASDEVLLFFDEEAASMAIDPSTLNAVTVHDLLLINEATHKCTVSRSETAEIIIRQGQLLVWRFLTEKYDIGFSIEMNSDVKLTYTRYNSHEKPAMGTIEATETCKCRLKWDNSYAKCKFPIPLIVN